MSPLFSPRKTSTFLQLLISFVVMLLLIFIKTWMPDIGRNAPFLLFTTAIIACGWYIGFVASMSVTLLSALLVSFVFISPFGILNQNSVSSLEAGVFLVESIFLSIFIEYVRHLREIILIKQQLTDIVMETTYTQGLIFLNEQNIITNINTGAQKIFGYKKEEIVGKPFSILCDKRYWFHKNNNPLYLHVQTKLIFTTERKVEYKIKVIHAVMNKTEINKPHAIDAPVSIPLETVSPSPLS